MTEVKKVACSVERALGKIHEFQKFGSILGLERMTELLEILGNPQDELKVFHVAGTNGKGSTCKYIYSVLQECGYKTGLYTSPFLEVFNERIEFDGEYISDEDLAEYTERVLAAVAEMTEAGKQSPTEFEVITALAFLYFAEKKADFVVLEVGLGGRGDSTNVCKKPLVSVITSISYDHTERLGNTLAEIASEKAGIIKEGCPVVTGAETEEALTVLRRTAAELGSDYMETRDLPCRIKSETLAGSCFDLEIDGRRFENLEISMPGEHQIRNAAAAVSALTKVADTGEAQLPEQALRRGLRTAKQHGRFEIMSGAGKKPVYIIDGAHNPDGARALGEAMNRFCQGSRILMITGMLADKDTNHILGEFLKITRDFIVTEPANPRKLPKEALKAKIEALGGNAIATAEPAGAFETARSIENEYDVILTAGSLYLIGEIRGIIRRTL